MTGTLHRAEVSEVTVRIKDGIVTRMLPCAGECEVRVGIEDRAS